MPDKLPGSSIQSGTIQIETFSPTLSEQVSSGGPKVSNLIYFGANNSARASGGQTITLNGSNFDSNVTVYIGGNAAPSVTYISASNVQFTTPALSVGTYLIYAINPDGGFGISAPGLSVTSY
jgi:hypothetical protein